MVIFLLLSIMGNKIFMWLQFQGKKLLLILEVPIVYSFNHFGRKIFVKIFDTFLLS